MRVSVLSAGAAAGGRSLGEGSLLGGDNIDFRDLAGSAGLTGLTTGAFVSGLLSATFEVGSVRLPRSTSELEPDTGVCSLSLGSGADDAPLSEGFSSRTGNETGILSMGVGLDWG